MAEFPELVGGENRFCTAVPLATHGKSADQSGSGRYVRGDDCRLESTRVCIED